MIDDRTEQEKQHWACLDCGKDTLQDNKDYYMLKHDVWEKISKDPKGMMCMDCVEKAVGHKLTVNEIMMAPLNTMFNEYTRSILIEAKVPVP